MADVIRMPRLSDTMQEGFIKTWLKKVGDTIKPGDILAEVETDKATMDLEAFQNGTLLHIQVPEGAVPVDGIIAIIGHAGEDITHLLNQEFRAPSAEKKLSVETAAASANSQPAEPVNAPSITEVRIKASPLAKSIAREKGLDLRQIKGTGENGRIIKRDLDQAGLHAPAKVAIASRGSKEVVHSQMRKTIAKRLSESKLSAPHFYLTMEIDMDACVDARSQLNRISAVKISFNDIIVKAVAKALQQHPAINVSWQQDKMIWHNDINIGVAVAVDDGLVVPVIRHADQKSLSELKSELSDKASRAKERKLSLDEMEGNTFTVSNLGMYDIEQFTAIINPPDACILAVGSIVKKPAVKNDQIVISHRMKVCLSCDHRAVDGATGAQFLHSLKQFLENPMSLIL